MSSESRGLLLEAWRILTWADKLLIAATLVCTITLLAARTGSRQAGTRVRVEASGGQVEVYSLALAQTLWVQGPLGVSRVEIAGGAARVAASPCREQWCVRQGWIRHQGEVVVCLPNQLLLQVEGGGAESALDAVSR